MNLLRSAALLVCLISSVAGPAMASGVGSITSIVEPMTRQVVQRRDDNVGNILVIGTCSGNISGFQGSSTLLPGTGGTPLGWTSLIDVTIFEGYFVGIFRQPAGGFYTLQIRPTFQGQAGEPMAVLAVGVGEVFLTAGQSNATNWGTPTGTLPNLLVSCFDDGPMAGIDAAYRGASWRWGYDPLPALDGSTQGSPWPTMASNLAEVLGVPIGLYSAGYGGTAIKNWLPGSVLVPGSATQPQIELFGRLTNGIEYFTVRGGVRAVLWIQGETDFGDDTDPTVYEAGLRSIIEQSRQVTGVPIKWMVAQTTTPVNYFRLTEKLALEQAQAAVVDNILTFPGPNADSIGVPYRLLVDGDPVHFNAAGLVLLGGYWGIYVANLPGFLYGGHLP
jgi:hypothetical protein